MANGNGLSLEGMHQELERLGSLVRSLSTQIAGVRVRVSDLEHWDTTRGKGGLKLLSKQPVPKGQNKGNPPGKNSRNQPGKGGGKGRGKGQGKGRGGSSR